MIIDSSHIYDTNNPDSRLLQLCSLHDFKGNNHQNFVAMSDEVKLECIKGKIIAHEQLQTKAGKSYVMYVQQIHDTENYEIVSSFLNIPIHVSSII